MIYSVRNYLLLYICQFLPRFFSSVGGRTRHFFVIYKGGNNAI